MEEIENEIPLEKQINYESHLKLNYIELKTQEGLFKQLSTAHLTLSNVGEDLEQLTEKLKQIKAPLSDLKKEKSEYKQMIENQIPTLSNCFFFFFLFFFLFISKFFYQSIKIWTDC